MRVEVHSPVCLIDSGEASLIGGGVVSYPGFIESENNITITVAKYSLIKNNNDNSAQNKVLVRKTKRDFRVLMIPAIRTSNSKSL